MQLKMMPMTTPMNMWMPMIGILMIDLTKSLSMLPSALPFSYIAVMIFVHFVTSIVYEYFW